MKKIKRITVLGATGMLGNAVLSFFAQNPDYEVHGTVRNSSSVRELQRIAPSASGAMPFGYCALQQSTTTTPCGNDCVLEDIHHRRFVRHRQRTAFVDGTPAQHDRRQYGSCPLQGRWSGTG